MKYTLGLDVGVSSVGWAILDLDKKRIHNIGVRIFDKAENPKNGQSLNAPRREARSTRRRLRRRKQRLHLLNNFFLENKLLDDKTLKEILNPNSEYNSLDVYELRAKALDEELSVVELYKVLHHLSKRRGFKSNRKVVEASDQEAGRVTSAINNNDSYLKDSKYRTVGEALYMDNNKFGTHKRNKRDDYSNSFSRQDYINELQLILDKQKNYSLKDISPSKIELLVYGTLNNSINEANAIMYQRPFLTSELINKMIGQCTFEPLQKRAPKSSLSFEIFKLASDLNNIQFIKKDASQKGPSVATLNKEQITRILEAAKSNRTITYKKVRQLAGLGDNYYATYVRGKIKDGDPFGEKNLFGSLKSYHDIKSSLKAHPKDWEKINNEDTLNQIALALTVNRTDEDILKDLNQLNISEEAIKSILQIKPTNFKTFSHISIKALQNINIGLLNGLNYDQACEKAGYNFLYKKDTLNNITNPVVKRAVSQTLKIIKAVVREYGAPYYIHIETARELAKDFKERTQLLKEQQENQEKNNLVVEKIKDFGITDPTGNQIIKYKLYEEQNGISLYTGKKIDLETLLNDDNAYQVDHIIPFSRSGNDGMANKTLVLTEENQLKANCTPYEAFGSNEERWQKFVKNVEATYTIKSLNNVSKDEKRAAYKNNNYSFKKRSNLLNTSYTNNEWNARALNDTRYITKLLKGIIREQIQFAEGPNKQRIINPAGTITAYMRKRWGLNKNREQNVLHHAVDAAVVAAIDQKMVLHANLFAKKQEITRALANAKTMQEKTNMLTGEITDIDAFRSAQESLALHKLITEKYFPEPWDRFSEELNWRTRNITGAELKDKATSFNNYDLDFIKTIKPIFVSRMLNHKIKGEAHKETLRSTKIYGDNYRTIKMPIHSITKEYLENSLLKQSDPQLYKTIKSRLEVSNNNPNKAFSQPIYKYNKNGHPVHVVKTIKVLSKQPSGFYINNGKAFVNNGSMVRLDVYSKIVNNNTIEHFFVPVYVHQIPLEKKGQLIKTIYPNKGQYSEVDDSFNKVCSLYPNDFVRIIIKGETIEGYYVKYDIAGGSLALIQHCSYSKTKESLIRLSPRQAVSIKKIGVDILGNMH